VPVPSVYRERVDGKTSACVSLGNFLGVSFIILFNSSVKMSRVSAMQVALLDTVLMTYVRRNWYGVVGRSFRLSDIRTSTERSLASHRQRTVVAIKV
jgi:hypothetical protein